MELLTTKIIALTLLGAFSLFFGLLPLRMRKVLSKGSSVRRERVVSCLLCFGGGVLLATVFTHMLPETREGFQAAAASGVLGEKAASYPLAEVVTCAGFFLIYFVEEFVHKIFFHRETRSNRKLTKLAAAIEEENNTSSHGHLNGTANHNHNNHNNNNNNNNNNNSSSSSDTSDKQDTRSIVYSITPQQDRAEHTLRQQLREEGGGVDNPVFAGDLEAASWNPAIRESILSTQNSPTTKPRGNSVCPEPPRQPPQQTSTSAAPHLEHGGDQGHGHSHLAIAKLNSTGIASNLRSLLVILALSFHSVFEGLAVGLQEKEVDVWYLLGAISAHKFVIAFCVGLELLAGGTKAGVMVIYMIVFALVSPLGVAFGILVTENLASDAGMGGHLYSVTVLQGLAGGTILYVTFFEVLERERSRSGGRLLRLFFVLFGFAAMASLEAVGGHSHGGQGNSHGHSHGGHGPEEFLGSSLATSTIATTTEDHHGHGHSHSHQGHSHHEHDH